MSFLGFGPDQAKKPLADVLPDGRKRLTRYFQVTTTGQIPPWLDLPPATADYWTDAPTGWTGLLLTYKKFEDDLAPKGSDTRPILTLIFEQIAASGETQVGEPDITYDQYNNKIVTIRWVQFSSTTPTPENVGTTAAPAPNADAILKEEVATDDGTLRQITRVYTTGGIMSDVSELRFGGKVITRTIVSLNEIPATPSGYTLVGPGVVYVRGLPLYTYQFAAAAGSGGTPGTGGEISVEYFNAQGAAVDFDPANPDTANGSTRAIIRYVSTPAITSNPITTPTGFVLVGIERSEETGYVLWTGTYYRGQGLVVDETLISDTGGLVIYHRVQFGSAPSTPSATIGGTVTLFDTSVKNDTGYVVYDYRWAEGDGEVARRYTSSQGGAVAFNPAIPDSAIGNVVCTITHFTATSVTSNPTSAPGASFYLISIDNKVAGGYRIWTAVYGHGDGLIIDETTVQAVGALIFYHRVEFGAAPSTPSATIGGTVTLFESSVSHRDGFDVYDYRWAEGDGQSSLTTDGQSDGALDYTVTTFTLASTTPAYPGSGTAYLIRLSNIAESAYTRNVAVYRKPPATKTFNKKINFTKPGNAVIGGSPIQLVFTSPVTMDILAEVEVSYGTSQISDVPFTVESYATYYETYTPVDTGIAVAKSQALGGYLAGASGTSGTGIFNGIDCTSWEYQLGSSTPSSFSAAVHVLDVDNDPYLTATDGTVVFRRTKVSYDFS